MNPLEQYTLDQLRARTSEKWTQYGEDVLPLWVAEMDAKMPEVLVKKLSVAISSGDVGYLSQRGFDAYAEAFANFAERHWGWKSDPKSYADVADVVSGCRRVIDAWLEHNPENAVIVSTPIYPPFLNGYAKGYRLVDAPLTSPADSAEVPFRLDFTALETAFKGATSEGRRAAYALCNPANPSGTVHTAEELQKLAELSREYGVLVVADEIHAPLVTARNFAHDGHSLSNCNNPSQHGKHSCFTPYLSVEGVDFGVTVVSASKAFSIPGMKAALVIPAESERARDLIWHSGQFRQASSEHIGAMAQTVCLNEADEWLYHLVQAIRNNIAYFRQLAMQYFPEAKVYCGEGTYFAWVDFSAYVEKGIIPREENESPQPAKFFRERAKVAVNPGRTFAKQLQMNWSGMPVPGSDLGKTPFDSFVRINLATSQEIIRMACERIGEALTLIS